MYARGSFGAALAVALCIGGCDSAATPVPADGGVPSWHSYGHDEDNTRHNPHETAISTETVATLREVWRFEEAAVTSTPTLRDGVVYFGDWRSALHARDAATGAEIWRAQLAPATLLNQINHSPYVTEDTVYAGGHRGMLWAVERATGAVRWETQIDAQANIMLWSSPVVIDDILVIGVGSYQVFIPAQPPFRGNIVGVSTATGEVLWRTFLTEGSGVSVWSSAAVDRERGLMFIGTGQEYLVPPSTPYSDSLLALRYETGELVWHQQFTAMDRFQMGMFLGPDVDVGATPNLFRIDDRDVVGVGDKAGRYFVCDRDTGEIVWRADLTQGGANGGVMASTAYADGVIYVVSNDGTSGGMAGVGGGPGRATIFALEASTGQVRWQVAVTPGSFGGLAIANGVLFVPTLAGELRAYDARDGRQLWTGTLGLSMGGGVSVLDGMVYAGYGWDWLSFDTSGGLVAFGLPSAP